MFNAYETRLDRPLVPIPNWLRLSNKLTHGCLNDTHHIFSVDEFYWEDRPRYYAALDAVSAKAKT